jgi:hypothetical protein
VEQREALVEVLATGGAWLTLLVASVLNTEDAFEDLPDKEPPRSAVLSYRRALRNARASIGSQRCWTS